MRMKILGFVAIAVLALSAGCTDEKKMENVQKTVLNDCQGKTVGALVGEIMEKPVWKIEKDASGKETVTATGTLMGEKLPNWFKQEKIMEMTFHFPLDPKADKYDPSALDGIPSLTGGPDSVLHGYKAMVCS